MRVAVFLGAGASKGSQVDGPPLGSELYSLIRDNVQDLRLKVIASEPMQSFGHYRCEDLEVQKGIPLGDWIEDALPQAAKEFETDFEAGMDLLTTINPDPYYAGAALLTEPKQIITTFMDWSLSERVMTNVASHLFDYSPTLQSLYYNMISALPDGSSVFTLNYDTLIEEVAAATRVALAEPACVHTSIFTHPEKTINYFQLHGGCTLFEGFSPPTKTMPSGMVAHTDRVFRLRKSTVLIDKDLDGSEHTVRMTLSKQDYDQLFASRAQLSFFRKDKFSALGGAYPKACYESYQQTLRDENASVFFCGCRFHPVDEHIWAPVKKAKAKIFWCGDKEAMSELPVGSTFIEERLSKKTIDAIGSAAEADI